MTDHSTVGSKKEENLLFFVFLIVNMMEKLIYWAMKIKKFRSTCCDSTSSFEVGSSTPEGRKSPVSAKGPYTFFKQ